MGNKQISQMAWLLIPRHPIRDEAGDSSFSMKTTKTSINAQM